MSDLHPGLPETDLDRAFAALTSDLSTHAGSPGAGAAIATARKRRRTRVAAVALVAAAAVAAVTLPQLVGDGDNSSVAGSGLPAAAPLSAESLTRATEGWTGSWEDINESNASTIDDLDSNCLAAVGGPQVEPKRFGERVFVSNGAAVVAVFVDYDNAPAGAGEFATFFDNGLSACNARVTQSTHGDAAVTHGSAGGSGSDVDEVWFARLGDRVAMFAVMGAATPATGDATEALTDIFLAALQEDSSYDTTSGGLSLQTGEGSSNATPASFTDIPLAEIREATGPWSDGWTDGGRHIPDNLPCFPSDWPKASAWGQGANIGNRGTLTYAETARATDAIAEMTSALHLCSSGPWSIHEGAGSSGTGMWASYDGGSLFVAGSGNYVAALQVQGLDVPSDETATRLIGLLEESLANPGSYTESAPQPSESAEP